MPKHEVVTLIEPNPAVALAVSNFLTELGFDVRQATWTEGTAPNSTVAVLEPGDVDTGTAVAEFRRHFPCIPLIVASGRGDVLHGTLTAPVWAITKPYHPEELRDLVEVAARPDWQRLTYGEVESWQ